MFKKSLIAAVLAVAATGSFAENYFQGSLGKGNINLDCGGSDCKKSNTGYKLLAGFEQGNGLAYEAQIINYGKVTSTTSTDAYKVSGLGGNVAYVGKINDNFGYRTAAGLGFNKAVNGSTSSKTTPQLTLGAGLAYNITKTIAATADFDVSRHKADGTTGELVSGTASLISFGIRAKF